MFKNNIHKFIFILLILFTVVIKVLFINGNIDFNKRKWESNIKDREKMINDLTQNILINKNKSEIINILGEPNKLYFQRANLVYLLGKENSIFSIDYQWLLIYLDSNNYYETYKIVTD